MHSHKIKYRVIYGDIDKLGIVYNANYLRWFEIGRNELFRDLGIPYKEIEEKGYFLPVSKVLCKFLSPIHYDDIIMIKTEIDSRIKAGIKFDYLITSEDENTIYAKGYTKHAFLDKNRKVCRPPEFLKNIILK